jgi:molecular chaperone DnaK
MAETLGIDLGTTKSVGAIWRDGAPMIIPDAEGKPIITPSVVAIDPDTHGLVVGHPAQEIRERCPQAAIYSIKRLMGRRWGEDIIRDDLEKARILYDVAEVPKRDGGIEVSLGDEYLSPQEVSAKILGKIKNDAETFLGHRISEAVVTVPAYFHDAQRQATRDAGTLALLTVKRVLNEPTAACLAFGYQKIKEEAKTVAVYDLGGGTFDISILNVGGGMFSVLATNGDRHLGGDDLDWLIVDWVLDRLNPRDRGAVQGDVQALARLRGAAERVKRALSTEPRGHVVVAGQLSPTAKVHDLDMELTQEELDALAEPWIRKTLAPCARALDDAHVSTAQLREVLMVGGQTRMPAVRRAVREFFGIEPNISIDPIQVVALGASVQAAIIDGRAKDLKLSNVIPLTLGVSTKGFTDTVIPRNTPLPTGKKKIYSTDTDYQTSVKIEICQGEHPLAKDNVKLAVITLDAIEPALKGVPQIEVEFNVDQDGILHVTATDLQSGNAGRVTIAESVGFGPEEIATMIRKAAEDVTAQLRERLEDQARPLPDDLASAINAELATAPVKDWSTYLSTVQDLSRQVQEADKSIQAKQ